jgi:hypothetical protein
MTPLRAFVLAPLMALGLVVVLLVLAAPPARAPGEPGDVAGATSPPPTPVQSPAPVPQRTAAPSLRPAPSATLEPAPSAIQPGSVNRTSLALRVSYDVKLSLGYGSRAIRVDSLMTITNRSGGPVDRVELNTIAARLGGLRVRAASVASKAVSIGVHDQTLVMPLGGILADGATVNARLIYTATLRNSLTGQSWMFTRANGVAELYRWLPWLSLERAFDRPNIGDPWVTPVSPRVRVAVTADRPLVIAAPGNRIAASGLTQTFEATDVRDFTIAASPDYRTGSAVVGDTTVRVYYRPGGAGGTLLNQAKAALARMEALVGPYPYGTYRVAESAGGYAIESPGVVWIPRTAPAGNLAYLVHHETAHQWFYGIVGADQANEPFTDEAVADFLTRHVLGTRRASRCATARLDLSIYRYSNACYYEVVYIQGGNFLNDLRVRMGSTAFWTGLRTWVREQHFAIAPTKSLLETLDEATPLNLVPRYEPRFPRLY